MSDKGSINNITLPVYKKLKGEISEGLATKADKVTIDSIETSYDEDTGVSTIIFPPYIMPLYFYCTELEMITEDACIFFDYTNEEVRDNYNQTIGGLEVDENKRVKVDIEGEIPQITDARLNYMMMDTEDNHVANINTYNLYNPSTPTKYYLHNLQVKYDVTVTSGEAPTQFVINLLLLSKTSTPYTYSNSYNGFTADPDDIILTPVTRGIQVKTLSTSGRNFASITSFVWYIPSSSGQTRKLVNCQYGATKPSGPPGITQNIGIDVLFNLMDGTPINNYSMSGTPTDTVIDL